jgi:predicted transcriptional regulator
MTPDPDVLSRPEFDTLSEIRKELFSQAEIPADHKAKLLRLGLIFEKSLEYRLTDAGERRWSLGWP